MEQNTQSFDAVVIGAGVSGLGIAWRLAQAGQSVAVLDRGEPGRGASWAAAGMLAAGVELEPKEEWLWPLNRLAQRRWPGFRDELEEASGHSVGYRSEGTLVVAPTRDDAARLRFNTDLQLKNGVEIETLTGSALSGREPRLKPGMAAAVFSPNDHQVDNRALALALEAAARASGVEIRPGETVHRLTLSGDRVTGIETATGRISAGHVVLAAGAWSRGIEGLPTALKPPVRPVKGQMISVRMDPEQPLLRHVVWGPNCYLVPRLDGRLLLGATVEEKGFDDAMTAGGVLAVLEACWRVLPGLEELPVDEMWAGHRPTSRDDAPILGPTPIAGLHYALGHHRNGILQAPVTADIVAGEILGTPVPEAARPFTIARFLPAVRSEAVE
ncbi:MAG: glycine oxidase ThiO [Alphaproteobacteria bacterium]|nr:glycine oxidase ThiO [Alphaproteobacteria bacterium]